MQHEAIWAIKFGSLLVGNFNTTYVTYVTHVCDPEFLCARRSSEVLELYGRVGHCSWIDRAASTGRSRSSSSSNSISTLLCVIALLAVPGHRYKSVVTSSILRCSFAYSAQRVPGMYCVIVLPSFPTGTFYYTLHRPTAGCSGARNKAT